MDSCIIIIFFCILLASVVVTFLTISEYKRGVRDGVRQGIIRGRQSAGKEMTDRAATAVPDMGKGVAERMGITDTAMEDTLILMGAAQHAIEQQFTDAAWKQGQGIAAPNRTTYAGKKINHCSNCGKMDKVKVRAKALIHQGKAITHIVSSCPTCDHVLGERIA